MSSDRWWMTSLNQAKPKIKTNMKKSFLLLITMGITLMLQAQVLKTVNCTAGGLAAALTASEKSTITNLTLTGTIDARDFKTMRDSMILLEELDLNGVTIIAYSGAGGPYLNTTDYPANVIPQNAFFNNLVMLGSILKFIVFPENITSIGADAFNRCFELKKVTFPASLTLIDRGAFFMCKGLTSVNFPSNITSIGDGAFNSCENIKLIQVNNANPVYLLERSTPFNLIDKALCKLYVPIGSKNAYQNAVVWKDFKNIIEGEMPLNVKTLKKGNDKVTLYPNPVSDGFKIKGLQGRAELTISDLSGKQIFSKEIDGNEYISANLLAKGMYIVWITNDKGRFEKKLVKE
jgi:hypothetical protein